MNKVFEEILEAIWMCEEQDKNTKEGIREICHAKFEDNILESMQKKELIAFNDSYIYMTGKGKESARGLIRRKRLGEVLLEHVLNIKGDKADRAVCEFEHAVIPEVEESICILLGHPTECPHGNKIPEGTCCIEGKNNIDKKVDCIANLEIGEKIKIAYIKPESHDRLHKLLNLGIKPGTIIDIHQKKPTLIIRCDNCEIAMDSDIANNIYGWRKETLPSQPVGEKDTQPARGYSGGLGRGWGFRWKGKRKRRQVK